MAQEIFRRTEKKFLLSEPQYTALIERFSGRMERDEYGRYEILNLYYDTEDCRMIRNSLGHPKYKEKLRLRSYGVPEKESMVFLELKKKYGGIVYKRRAELSLAEAENWMDRGIPPKRDAQILREIDYVRRQWDLSAKAEISYEREAWRGIREREFRITFDRRLRARRERLFLEEGPFGEELLPGGTVLMEVKVLNAFPLWLSGALSELGIRMTSFSKYGSYYRKELCREPRGRPEKEGIGKRELHLSA